jgi:hypothetical protein
MKNVLRNKQEEGRVAKAIEGVTAKLPSDLFLWSAIGAMAASAILQLANKRHIGLFFGQWVAPMLLFGVYNKLVKQAGHDKDSREVEESPIEKKAEELHYM